MRRISPEPSISGIIQSVMTIGKRSFSNRRHASAPSCAGVTSYPHFSREFCSNRLETESSSAIKIFIGRFSGDKGINRGKSTAQQPPRRPLRHSHVTEFDEGR